jgi:hypothetical protein
VRYARAIRRSNFAALAAALSLIAAACATTAGLVGKPCGSARPPSRPPPVAEPTDGPTVTFVFSRLELVADYDSDGQLVGFDLDGRCTQDRVRSSCRLHGQAPSLQDDELGRDNIVGQVMRLFVASLKDSGAGSEPARVVIDIRGWNGRDDDDDVRIDFYVSHVTETTSDGTVAFRPTSDSFFVGADPQFIAEKAFVRGRVLHAERIPKLRIDFAVPPGSDASPGDPRPYFELALTDGMLSVPLPPEGGTSSQGGVLGARAAAREIVASLSVIEAEADGGFLCGTNETFENLRRSICEGADIRTFANDDGRTDEPCDALSFGFKIDLERATLSKAVDDSPKAPRGCADAGSVGCPPP